MKNITFGHYTMMTMLVMTSMMTACKKLIEIPPNPPTEITQSQQFADSATTMTAMANIYSYQANQNGFMFDDGYLDLCGGLSSDEISTTTGISNDVEFYEYGVTRFNDYISSLWNDPYSGLYPVNAALSGIAGSSGLSASLKTQLTGELEVVRSLYNFYLVNLFGPVPLITSIDYTVTSKLGRASVDSIYKQIMTDLTAAQQALTVNYAGQGHYRPNLYVVKAFLAKVYLYQQNWQAAYDAADTVINSGQYALEPNLNNVFLDGSREAIWQLPATGSYLVTKEAENYVPQISGTVPKYPLTTFLLNAFEPGDLRLQDWTDSVAANTGSGNQTYYYPYKYKNINAFNSSTTEDFMIFRLGEQYLIHAEAAAELGQLGTALSDLNTVRARAGLPASTASTQSALLTAIMHERQVELFGEWGNRWLDLIRTGTAGTVLNAEKGGFQSYMTLYPLPNAQLEVSTLLTQNQGYN
ncbi:MAG TPA: RagB/SusD family nutrient uptake outer membrane protein [Puia sp.]|nr:RagB/SusD family nutrient uptake outer membrane protein [Puia sp.]